MDINFPLILVVLTFVSGAVWLLDKKVLAKTREEGEQRPTWVEYSGSFFPVLLLVLVLRSFLFEPFQIPSASMVPTLKVGDFILVNKYAYGLRLPVIRTKVASVSEPRRGDVMVFFPPDDKRYFIKRVVGLPGDKVRIVNNQLFINDEEVVQTPLESVKEDPRYLLAEEALGEQSHVLRKRRFAGQYGQYFETVVPDGHYFMMGDNRDHSSDSRAWGPVPEANIVGKAIMIWMHWEKFFNLPSFERVGTIQ